MPSMIDKVVITAASCVFKKKKGDLEWFLVKNDAGEWEVPKTQVRNGESSVRGSIRSMAEDGAMRAKVIEEVGRAGGATKVGEKIMTSRIIYYLMSFREGGESIGFVESGWYDHSNAIRKVSAKRDNQMLKDAKVLIDRLEKEQGKKFKTGAAAIKDEEEEAAPKSSDDDE